MIRQDIAELPSGRWDLLPDGGWQHTRRPDGFSRVKTVTVIQTGPGAETTDGGAYLGNLPYAEDPQGG